jgi:hypothetical protein
MLIKGLVCKQPVMPAAINMSVKTPLNQKNVTGNWELLFTLDETEQKFV